MELAFGIDSSVSCRMIVSLLVVTTNIATPDADASDEDGTAAHDDLHQQFIKINIRQKLTSLLEIRRRKLRQCSS